MNRSVGGRSRQMHDRYLNLDEVCQEWSPPELLTWVSKTCERIVNLRGGATALRLLEGTCKTLLEEIYPLAIFAAFRYVDSPNVRVRPVLGNQPYDALIIESAGPIRLEITQAREEEAEYLRSRLLDERGWAPTTGRVNKRGTKHTGLRIEIDRSATTAHLEIQKQLKLIHDRIAHKCKKAYAAGTHLLVMFEDSLVARAPDLMSALQSLKSHATDPFAVIHLFGWSKKTYINWST
jgi:hypothetical protein